jgi:uncharacterized surface protein with fasciclin (FAS1) repeats
MTPTRLLTIAAALTLAAGAAMAQTATPAPRTTAPTTAPATGVNPAPAGSTPAPMSGASTPAAGKVVANGDIIQTMKLSGEFNTFVKAADATNLTTLLKNNKDLTVFAPTDAAFAALPPGELDKLMADKPRLQKLLTYHIINARVDSNKIKGAKGQVPTVAGSPVELDGGGEMLMVNNADIVQPDVMASNGIVHVIDKVLTPGAMAAGSSGASASATAPAAPSSPSTTTPAGKTQ